MTIFQIIALALAGPLAIMCFAKLFVAFIYRNQNFHFVEAVVLVFSVVAILVSFFGVK